MTKLNRIELSGFKSFEKVELELTDLNVVIGPNGCGKSNLIGAFKFLERIVSERLQLTVAEQGGAARFLHHGPKHTNSIGLRFEFGKNRYEVDAVPAVGDTLIIRDEAATYFGFGRMEKWRVALAQAAKESRLRHEAQDPAHRIAAHVLRAVSGWAVAHFHDTSDTAPAKQACEVDDNRTLRADGGNLAAVLHSMRTQSPVAYAAVVSHVRQIAPFFDDFVLEPSTANRTKIKLEWRHRGSDAYFDGYSLSDGTLRFICLATLLLQPNVPSVILIDEPELGLHPAALVLLAELLRAAALRVQVLAATQSVTLLNRLDPEHVIVAEHDGRKTSLSRLTARFAERGELDDWLADYAIGELWEKNVLGGRPRG